MSSSTPGQPSVPYPDFQSIFDAALREYKKKTVPLLDRLAAQLQRCESVRESVDTIILRGQAEAFSATAGNGVSLVRQ